MHEQYQYTQRFYLEALSNFFQGTQNYPSFGFSSRFVAVCCKSGGSHFVIYNALLYSPKKTSKRREMIDLVNFAIAMS